MKPPLFRCCLTGAALLLAGPAQATLERMNTPSGNPSMAFIALDSTGTPTSLFVDLGSLLSDFDPIGVFPLRLDSEGTQIPPTGIPGSLMAPDTTVIWDFRGNTVTVNGVSRAGTYLWADELAKFEAAAQAQETGWAVIGGSADSFPNYFFTTGNPTAAQISNQGAGDTANMALVDVLYANQYGYGTIPAWGVVSDVNGAHAQVGGGPASTGYVGNPGNFNTAGTWRANLKWSAFVAVDGSSAFYTMNDNLDTVDVLPGTFSYSNGALTWQTTPIPEPAAMAMALVGLGVLGAAGRRSRQRASAGSAPYPPDAGKAA